MLDKMQQKQNKNKYEASNIYLMTFNYSHDQARRNMWDSHPTVVDVA